MKEIRVEAYELVKKKKLEDINSVGYLLRHKKSGARLFLVSNDDENKVFTVGFRTPPADDTGTQHIIEHSVLCGSRKFPPKDPFIELVKGSLNTFLNAITYADKTIYPVASCNDVDFQNLMDVYLDAVFYPSMQKKEELFLQEGWHYELENPDGEITVNGVVYNEMKGAYSSPEEILTREIYRSLFPDTSYSKDSGGCPECILELTYEQLKAYHGTYYHPSNSYIYLYGDMDMNEKLEWLDREYLSHFDKIGVGSEIKLQEPFMEMAEYTGEYPISIEEEETGKTFFSYNAVVETSLDKELYLAFEILDYALVSAPGAPVRTALMDAGIGKDVSSSFDNGIFQPVFSVSVQNADATQKQEFMDVVLRTLKEQAEHGIDPKSLLAGINSDEFKFREADFGNFPKGLLWGIQSFDSWLYDENDPFLHLEEIEVYARLREKIGTGYFENLIEKYLLNNPHSSLVVLTPSKGLAGKTEEALCKKLSEKKDKMSVEELEQMAENTKYLRSFQETPSTKEELETIPMLTRADLNPNATPFQNREVRKDGVLLLEHEMFAGHITYVKLLFDMRKIPKELVPYVGLYKAVLSYVDTDKYSYAELTNEINLQMGGMTNRIGVYRVPARKEDYKAYFEISLKTFDEKIEDAFALLAEIMAHSKLDDKKRLKEIISQIESRLEYSLSSSGNQVGAVRAMSYYSQVHALNDHVAGIEFYRLISWLEQEFDTLYPQIAANLEKVHRFFMRPENLMLSVTAGEEGLKTVRDRLDILLGAMESHDVEEEEYRFACEKKNEGFKDASQVQYVCQAGNFIDAGYEYKGTLRVLKGILNCDYLWNQIRVLGGAYGCGSAFTKSGDVMFSSYRDPKLLRTLETYRNIPDYIRAFTADEREMTKYIIGTVNEMDAPLNPLAKGNRSLAAYLNQTTLEEIQKERDEILTAQPEQIRELADLIEAVLKQDYICVIGNEQMIEQEKEPFMNIEKLL
ncbi:MAG: insulinase family protein [Eubacterium sp.]|nr:insulinase family protein [Eubacterium sp.]